MLKSNPNTHNDEANEYAQVVKNIVRLETEITLNKYFNEAVTDAHKEGVIRAAKYLGYYDTAKELEADLKELKTEEV